MQAGKKEKKERKEATTTENRYAELLGETHQDVNYLKQQDISLVLSKALAETYKAKPQEPLKYFAKYLLSCAETKRKEKQRQDDLEEVVAKKSDFDQREQVKAKEQQAATKQKEAEKDERRAFFQSLKDSLDLADNLKALTDFLKTQTGATGVYVGKLQCPEVQIKATDDDKAHLDNEAPKVIKFIHVSEGSEFVQDAVLQPYMGLTHEVFGDEFTRIDPASTISNETIESMEESKVQEPADILTWFKHIFVPEVVREKKIHFQKVPRLGSFMAVPIVYKSCLFYESLEQAIQNKLDVIERRAEQDREKALFEEKMAAEKELAVQQGIEWEPSEVREWPEITVDPFVTVDEKYVICLDTMGQDRQFTDDEKRFTLNTVNTFIKEWEQNQINWITIDRDRKIDAIQAASVPLEQEALDIEQEKENQLRTEIEDYKWQNDADDTKYFGRVVTTVMTEGEEEKEEKEFQQKDDLIGIENDYKYVRVIAERFHSNPEWKEQIEDLFKYRVIKYPHIIQALLFFIGFKNSTKVCFPRSNALNWKATRNIPIEWITKQMVNYQLLGEIPRDKSVKHYQTIPFIEKLIEPYLEEDIASYHKGLDKLFKWLRTAITMRKNEIIRRKSLAKKRRDERADCIQREEDRVQRRQEYLIEQKAQWDQDNAEAIEEYNRYLEKKQRIEAGEEVEQEDDPDNSEPPTQPKFNEEETLAQFDEREENAVVTIPPEEQPENDIDWPMTVEEEFNIVQDHLDQLQAMKDQKEAELKQEALKRNKTLA